MLTLSQFLALSPSDQLRDERIAIMCESGMSEEEAVAVLDQVQGKLEL